MIEKSKKTNLNLRFNIITVFIYIIGVILVCRLFTLQIVEGKEYREQSNTRLSRKSELQAARGSILSSSSVPLVTTTSTLTLEMYKTKVDTDTLNRSILNMINVLEKYKVKYVDTFPISIDPFGYQIEGEKLKKWKKKNKIDDEMSAQEAFYEFKDKYKIKNTDNKVEIRKIIAIRYELAKQGYSNVKTVEIAKDIPRGALDEFSERSSDFSGINIVTKPIRKYTSGNLASHILGYASRIDPDEYEKRKEYYNPNDIIGKTGIEAVFEEYLKGKNGTKQIDMNVDGTVTAEYIAEEAISGSDIVLTIDANLQKITETSLKETIDKISAGGFAEKANAKAGSCVVMNVKNGEILAMASYPDYNPADFVGGISNENWNKYRNNEEKPLINRAIQSYYAPGSTFKMVTAIAGLETRTITTATKINDIGQYKKYKDYQPKCWIFGRTGHGHGWLNVSQAIEKSCNYFFYETADKMGIDNLVRYAKFFGLGSKTGIELQGESRGTLASKETWEKLHPNEPWGPGYVLQAAIGQNENRFTPIQMARYISILVNGGKRINPTIIKTIRNPNGTEASREEIDRFSETKLGKSEDNVDDFHIQDKHLRAVLDGMKSVTSDTGGTAYWMFKDFNISVGGKTGSAEVENGKVHAWFTGFAPFENPEIAIIVMIENGLHGNYAGEVVKNIMTEYFGMNIKNIEEKVDAIPYVEISN